MNPVVFRRAMLCTCWLPILGSLLAASIQALRLTNRPPEYTAMGKIMAGMLHTDGKSKTAPKGFYESHIEMLQSGGIRERAMERVRGLHPELKECVVDLTVTQASGSSILTVGAIGSDRRYTCAYLDAVLDEYMSMRREMLMGEHDAIIAKVIDEVLVRERSMEAAKIRFDAFVAAGDTLELLSAEKSRLTQLVSQLRGEMEALKASGSPADDTSPTKLDAIRTRIKEGESNLRDVNERFGEGETLKETYDRARHDYEEWKSKLDQIAASVSIVGDPVAIVERPADAIERAPDLWLPLIVAAAMGFLGGFLLMLVISLIAAARTASLAAPPPLP